jgi:hypothetical protein
VPEFPLEPGLELPVDRPDLDLWAWRLHRRLETEGPQNIRNRYQACRGG